MEIIEGTSAASVWLKLQNTAISLWVGTASSYEDATGMTIMVDLFGCVIHTPMSVQKWEKLFFPFLGSVFYGVQ